MKYEIKNKWSGLETNTEGLYIWVSRTPTSLLKYKKEQQLRIELGSDKKTIVQAKQDVELAKLIENCPTLSDEVKQSAVVQLLKIEKEKHVQFAKENVIPEDRKYSNVANKWIADLRLDEKGEAGIKRKEYGIELVTEIMGGDFDVEAITPEDVQKIRLTMLSLENQRYVKAVWQKPVKFRVDRALKRAEIMEDGLKDGMSMKELAFDDSIDENTANQYIQSITYALAFYKSYINLDYNRDVKFKLFKYDKNKKAPIEPEDIREIAKGKGLNRDLTLSYSVLGSRKAEFFHGVIKEIDGKKYLSTLKDDMVEGVKLKNEAAYRIAPINDRLVATVERAKEWIDSLKIGSLDHVNSRIKTEIIDFDDKYDNDKYSGHSARHTAISMLGEQNGYSKEVKDYVGHAQVGAHLSIYARKTLLDSLIPLQDKVLDYLEIA